VRDRERRKVTMMIRHNSSKKTKIGKDSNSLPPDLLIEILSRLPVKVVSRAVFPCIQAMVNYHQQPRLHQIVPVAFDSATSTTSVLLCMSDKLGDYSKVPSSEHKVFTLMGREGKVAQTWRMVKCNTSPHCPKTNGVCINGVLYYVASTGKKKISEWFLMRFDVRTEKLGLLSRLSWRLYDLDRLSLINYQGKVTFVVQTCPSSTIFDLWVMEDT
ncbi:hypothetical protein HID58_032918, partial [Brassica napus]